MASITFYNPESPLLFCEEQLDENKLLRLAQSPIYQKGLNHPFIPNYLNNCQYPQLLTALWGEQNPFRHLAWLEKHAGLHAPLMCERAIAIFVANRSIETITGVVLPLLEAAFYRVKQDCTCSTDPTVCDDTDTKIKEIYLKVLCKKMNELTPHLSLAQIRSDQQELISQKSCEKVIEVLNQSIQGPNSLPSPKWISQHGLIANESLMHSLAQLNNDHNNTPPPLKMVPETSWETHRRAFARQMIAHLQRTPPPNVS